MQNGPGACRPVGPFEVLDYQVLHPQQLFAPGCLGYEKQAYAPWGVRLASSESKDDCSTTVLLAALLLSERPADQTSHASTAAQWIERR